MAADPLESRLRFLSQAANVLAVSAPTISANLGAAHRVLLEANDKDIEMQNKEWDELRRNICGSCGNVMMPGLSCSVSRHTEHERKKRAQSKGTKKEEPKKKAIYTCSLCHRKTAQLLPSRPPKHIGVQTKEESLRTLQSAATATPIEQESKIAKSANATSKQRKKTRKGGLQAMLEKSKASTSSSGGLDLMDFLQ
ncbi:hypothetical protein DM02DRAFT_319252 [Periconia macrospinosa]|uniref:Rpr2-domain-containing protein n=1 Tax=Periconia macrospinosa TaxID=97972 RepID=A0A2V1DXN4_9PLEO|nr:hypothetical protein DM02DRAFT_319252 [Periconia macrospinosa]